MASKPTAVTRSGKEQIENMLAPPGNGNDTSTSPPILLFLEHTDLWVDKILPFLGMGHYAFVGAANKRLNEVYQEYCQGIKNPPRVVYLSSTEKIRRPANSTDTFYGVALYNLTCAEYYWNVHCMPYHDDTVVCKILAKTGNLQVLQWARRQHDFPWDWKTCREAAIHGHLHMLQWVRENGCPWNISTCTGATRGGHLHILQWACANGCPWDEATCSAAANRGDLEMLQWAHRHGCPWDESTCAGAAFHGHLELLKWARANGCPWDKWTCRSASIGKHAHVLEWARENGCPEE